MREIRGIPQTPVQGHRLAQGINDEDGPEDGDGFLPVAQRIGQRRGLGGGSRDSGSFFHERRDLATMVDKVKVTDIPDGRVGVVLGGGG